MPALLKVQSSRPWGSYRILHHRADIIGTADIASERNRLTARLIDLRHCIARCRRIEISYRHAPPFSTMTSAVARPMAAVGHECHLAAEHPGHISLCQGFD